MAKQMTEFTNANILSQAATAMLAQANSLPQGVLSLLQGRGQIHGKAFVAPLVPGQLPAVQVHYGLLIAGAHVQKHPILYKARRQGEAAGITKPVTGQHRLTHAA